MSRQLDAMDIAKIVQDRLRDSKSTALFARVIADQVRPAGRAEPFWYVPVAYQQDPNAVYQLFEVFSSIEEELEASEQINILIVPRLLPPPSNLVA